MSYSNILGYHEKLHIYPKLIIDNSPRIYKQYESHGHDTSRPCNNIEIIHV